MCYFRFFVFFVNKKIIFFVLEFEKFFGYLLNLMNNEVFYNDIVWSDI